MPPGAKLEDATRVAITELELYEELKDLLCSFFPNVDPDHHEAEHIALSSDPKLVVSLFELSGDDLLKFMKQISRGSTFHFLKMFHYS